MYNEMVGVLFVIEMDAPIVWGVSRIRPEIEMKFLCGCGGYTFHRGLDFFHCNIREIRHAFIYCELNNMIVIHKLDNLGFPPMRVIFAAYGRVFHVFWEGVSLCL